MPFHTLIGFNVKYVPWSNKEYAQVIVLCPNWLTMAHLTNKVNPRNAWWQTEILRYPEVCAPHDWGRVGVSKAL